MKSFDDKEVLAYRGKFSTPFEMTAEEGIEIEQGDIVYFLVRTHAIKAEHKTDKHGDLTRTNTFSVTDVQGITQDELTKSAVDLFLERVGKDLDMVLEDSMDVYDEDGNPLDDTEDDSDFAMDSLEELDLGLI